MLYIIIASQTINPTLKGKDPERNKVEMEKEKKKKVSQELTDEEEKEKQKKQKKRAKDLLNAMQNTNDSLIRSQHKVRNKLVGISDFDLDQYIRKVALGMIALPTSNEDSDQSPLRVRSRI